MPILIVKVVNERYTFPLHIQILPLEIYNKIIIELTCDVDKIVNPNL